MRKLLLFLFAFVCLASNAAPVFDGKTRYYITSDFCTGYLYPSSEHFASYIYDLYMYDGPVDNDEGHYWYISGDEASGYVFRNAHTGRYMSWSDDYNTKRNFELTDEMSDGSRWDIVFTDEGSTNVGIRHHNNTDYHLNIRSHGTSIGYVANYNSKAGPDDFTASDKFHIFDEDGNAVTATASFDSSEHYDQSDDFTTFNAWTSKNKGIDSSSSTHTITFSCIEGSVLDFDWNVSSEGNFDDFSVSLDGNMVIYSSGYNHDHYTSAGLSAGQHTLVFSYVKNERYSEGDDEATVNNIFLSYGNVKTITFHCIDYDSNQELGTRSETFYGSYTLSAYPAINGYEVYNSSAPLNSTFDASADIYVYYVIGRGLPFMPTTISNGQFASSTQWYRMSIRGGKQLYVKDNSVYCDTKDTPYDPAFFWCFVEAGNDQYCIYNYSTGASLPMSAESNANSTYLSMSNAGKFRSFEITDNSPGFNIQLPATGSNSGSIAVPSCCNDFGSNGILRLWTDTRSVTDAGSRVEFELVGNLNFTPIEELSVKGVAELFLTESEQTTLKYTYLPADAGVTAVVWSSDNSKVASVDQNGHVTAMSEGTATITVAAVNDPSVFATYTIHVTAFLRVSSITAPAAMELAVGQSANITCSVIPSDAHNTSVSFFSSNTDVVRVDGSGRLTAVAEGTATITIRANDDSGVTAQCLVTVSDVAKGILVEHSDEYLYLTSAGNALLALPTDYIDGEYSLEANGRFTAALVCGSTFERSGILSVDDELPVELPTFTSYKFNNKFNYQLTADIIAEEPSAQQITIPVGAIGKRLTASFQVPDKEIFVWAEGERQFSKETRLRFDHPITYTIGRDAWVEVQLLQMPDGSYEEALVPFGYHTTVTVDWLTDRATSAYGVPEVYITTDDGDGIRSKTEYKTATIEIVGGGVFPDFAAQAVNVKGRGNNTWGGYGSKNPYRLKFDKKQSPFGLSKSKSWVLLTNKLTGSMMTNAIGQKAASLMGCVWPCHIIPVELYINGIYQGSYNFTEKVSFSNSSIDLDDESYAAMMELDTYSETNNTPPLTYANAYKMAAKINEPDIYDKDEAGNYTYEGALTVEDILNDFNQMTLAVKNGDYDSYVDLESLVSYLAVCELIAHCELKHSKSVFCYSENVTDGFNAEGYDETPWIFGPLWDCDWAFGYEQSHNYFVNNIEGDLFNDLLTDGKNYQFWNDLRYGSSTLDQGYYYRWHNFMTAGGLDELLEYCDDYYAFAARSLEHNSAGQFANDRTNYASLTATSKNWLKARANYVYSTLTPYPLEGSPFIAGNTFEPGDTNADGKLSMVDVTRLMRIALGLALDTYGTADVNGDGSIDRDDIEALAHKILDK